MEPLGSLGFHTRETVKPKGPNWISDLGFRSNTDNNTSNSSSSNGSNSKSGNNSKVGVHSPVDFCNSCASLTSQAAASTKTLKLETGLTDSRSPARLEEGFRV